MMADEADTTLWRNVDHVVAELGLDVDPTDLELVTRSLRDGMRRYQNSDQDLRWVSAYVFVKEKIVEDKADQIASLPALPSETLPAIRGTDALAGYSPTIEQRADRARSRTETAIRVRARRINIGYASVSVLIGALWALPTDENPLVRAVSPYEFGKTSEDLSGTTEGFKINGLRASIWIAFAFILIFLWIAAFARHHRERRILEDANDFRYQAAALRLLQASGRASFTQAEYETQLLDRRPRDYLCRDEMSLQVPAATVIRIIATFALILVMTAAMYGVSQTYADAYYADRSPSLLIFPGVILFELLLGAAVFSMWIKPINRESAIAALRFLPTEETVLPIVRGAAEPALARFVQRGTLKQLDDRDYMPTYAFVGAEGPLGRGRA